MAIGKYWRNGREVLYYIPDKEEIEKKKKTSGRSKKFVKKNVPVLEPEEPRIPVVTNDGNILRVRISLLKSIPRFSRVKAKHVNVFQRLPEMNRDTFAKCLKYLSHLTGAKDFKETTTSNWENGYCFPMSDEEILGVKAAAEVLQLEPLADLMKRALKEEALRRSPIHYEQEDSDDFDYE